MNSSNSNPSRRVFMLRTALATGALLMTHKVSAQSMLLETDPQAAALSYKADATKVDKAKQTRYAAGQICGNCVLFKGAPSSPSGSCAIFAGKQVATKGWCSAYAKKA